VVARIAREHDVDLYQVTGTGRDGRITKQDVLAYIEGRDQAAPSEPAAEEELPPWERPGSGDLFKPTDDLALAASEPGSARARPAAPTRPAAAAPAPASGDEQLVPHTRLRKLIAEHMLASRRTSPHVTTVMEADMSAVVAHRAAHRAEFAAKGVALTFTPYFIQAIVAALKAVPQANAVYREDGLLLKRRYHIGMATAIDDGLVVPVIRDADELSLQGLARAVNDLAQRARAGQLKPDEIQGSTFTLTNHGVSGSLMAMPIINQPNVGILGVGAIQKRPVVISRGHPVEPSGEDYLAIRPMVYLSFTFDHRVLDGASGDAFVGTVKRVLEGWGKV
jgi:2-oxoglutarate dehydrogenase E2 component (dihydrolipoamide succinyltransferase)